MPKLSPVPGSPQSSTSTVSGSVVVPVDRITAAVPVNLACLLPGVSGQEVPGLLINSRIKAQSFDRLFISSPGTSCPLTPGSKHAKFTGPAAVIPSTGTTTQPTPVDVDDCGELGAG